MISQVKSAVVGAYTNNTNEGKRSDRTASQKAEASISSQGDTSKIDQIKNDIASGQYKVNLEALSQKIADELL
ncbi:flagellar biosynthesis anti-sigma factor FlgM [Sulfurimonas lithotrophica]|uniref:Flagellar biosynthesis anti-sigma factor FlgM n=1 Tax=Sulfurimonas lithotrophica TaxID=2590022 RepID=A0A5P8NYZ8_9BACT|nr:flagellar biosynthesis anti-sigma factor FlgM [Sulfurimonas lithotrophica]QFR48630.1 flagellar biosynthesis anti-sigma factor FlgM [Sulfurimonas lithotrophica]